MNSARDEIAAMQSPFDASTIIFGLLAIFVVWKLRSVLGTRVGIDKKPEASSRWHPAAPDVAARDAATVSPPAAPSPAPAAIPAATLDPPTLAASRGLEDIRRADRAFDAQAFVGGAQSAYRMIIEGFSRGDRAMLGNLLGDEALRTFTAALDERGSAAPTTISQVADIERVGITGAALKGTMASIALRFKAHIVETPVAPGDGSAVAAAHTIDATDLWTFSRDVRNSDPNWKLVATSTDDGHAA